MASSGTARRAGRTRRPQAAAALVTGQHPFDQQIVGVDGARCGRPGTGDVQAGQCVGRRHHRLPQPAPRPRAPPARRRRGRRSPRGEVATADDEHQSVAVHAGHRRPSRRWAHSATAATVSARSPGGPPDHDDHLPRRVPAERGGPRRQRSRGPRRGRCRRRRRPRPGRPRRRGSRRPRRRPPPRRRRSRGCSATANRAARSFGRVWPSGGRCSSATTMATRTSSTVRRSETARTRSRGAVPNTSSVSRVPELVAHPT